jgi:hypothetical protein
MPSGQGIAFAREQVGHRTQLELDKFCDYWRARAGPGGTKLDWDATWRNWVRSAAERKNGNGRGKQTLYEIGLELVEEAKELERAAGIGRENGDF